jgi:Acetyltransferases
LGVEDLIRVANLNDKSVLMTLIHRVVADMQGKGIDQWDLFYPNAEVIQEDLESGTLYVDADKETIRGMIVLNEDQSREYATVDWNFRSNKALVIHRLCVDPRFQGNGIAGRLMGYAETFGCKQDYQVIRLDTFSRNPYALRLYDRLGYRRSGIVWFPKGKFYCFEKKL